MKTNLLRRLKFSLVPPFLLWNNMAIKFYHMLYPLLVAKSRIEHDPTTDHGLQYPIQIEKPFCMKRKQRPCPAFDLACGDQSAMRISKPVRLFY